MRHLVFKSRAISWNVHWSNIYSNTGSSPVLRPTQNNFSPPSPVLSKKPLTKMSSKYVLKKYRLQNAVCLWTSLHGKTKMDLRDLERIKIVENLPWFQSDCKTVSYSMNIFWLMQRPNPIFDVTDDIIACFQHHLTCGGKQLEWQSLSHKNW